MRQHGHRTGDTFEHDQVVELANRAIDAERVHAGTIGKLDDLHAAPRLGVRFLQALIQGQAFEPACSEASIGWRR